MKVLIASNECSPLAGGGAFADSVGESVRRLAAEGVDATLVMPLHRCVRENRDLDLRFLRTISVRLGDREIPAGLHEAEAAGGVRVLFVERDEFFDRSGLYGARGRDYQDNAARFIFFSKAVVEAAVSEGADVLHVHGWHAALAPVFLRDRGLPVASLLSPFSLEFQGNFWSHEFPLTGLGWEYFSASGLEFYGSMNFLKAGIVFADAVVLPGGRSVAGMQTPAHGCGLENVLRENAWKLEGIAPGIGDAGAPVPKTGAGDRRKALERLFPASGGEARVVVLDTVSTAQEGVGIVLEALDRLPSDTLRVVMLGHADAADHFPLGIAVRRHAERFAWFPEPSPALLADVLACGDFLLLPAPVEPNASFLALGMRNSLVPMAMHCEGLHELLRDHDASTGDGNALIHHTATTAGLVDAFRRAAQLDATTLEVLSRRVAATDFSWKRGVHRLLALYRRLAPRGDAAAA
jgi:starch synthase